MKLLVATLALVLLLPAPADARTKRPSPLFEDAGFAHAMSHPRTPVRIERSTDERIHAAVAYWNIAAQWELLVFSDDPEVTFRHDPSFCSWCARWSSYAPYDGCTVFYDLRFDDSWGRWSGFSHEIGHCLGFRHLDKGMTGGQTHNVLYDAETLRLAGYRDCKWNISTC